MLKPVAAEPALMERVRDAIVDAIVDGSLRSGQRLAQEEIARRLGVSRQPVSHALRVLREQGVLVELGRKGLTVAPLEPARLGALYAVRASLDELAARSAAARVAAGDAPRHELDVLCDLAERHSRPPMRGRITALVDADVAFHVGLYRVCGNPWIEAITAPHWVHFRRCMHAVLEDRALRGDVWPEHREILDAILAGDGDRAGRLAEHHARRAGETTAARLGARTQILEDAP